MLRLKRNVLVVGFLLVSLIGFNVFAAEFPAKPIQLLTPSSPGGSSDVMMRLIADYSSKYLGKAVVVVNRPGGGGTVALAALKRAPADGYTIMQAPNGLFVSQPHMRRDSSYKIDDFEYIIGFSREPIFIGVLSSSPYKSLKDLLEAAKAKPNSIRFGTSGVGTLLHLGMEQIALSKKVKMIHIPFQGGAKTVTNLIGGHIDVGLAHPTEMKPQIEAGNVRILGVLSKKRLADFPDIPTALEQGFRANHEVWKFMLAPKGAPQKALSVMHDAFNKVLNDPGFLAKARELNLNIYYRDAKTIRKELKRQYAEYGKVVQALNITAK